MNNVNKTLYIPLYGKALVSRRGILLSDKKAEEIWKAEEFPLKGKSRSKWLAFYMAMRARVFDEWLSETLAEECNAVVVHIGCGMDSRIERLGAGCLWYDVDFPEVVAERKRYYSETETYRMIGADMRDSDSLDDIPSDKTAVIVMEGVSMYVKPTELEQVIRNFRSHFGTFHLLMDCYTSIAAKTSKYKNPINDVGVTQVYGMDDPVRLAEKTGITFCKEHEMTPAAYINELKGSEHFLFRHLFGGRIGRRLYRMYEFAGKCNE